ncbi:MAG TPA: inner membrane CreD family protein, partial [Nevskiaceae bacterium]|nr:inner membrane CreD family protein [Nevskiaceae bacterium]
DFPQAWRTPANYHDAIAHAAFGVQLVTPADTYCMADRIGKYAVLTLVFTFLTLWLMESLSGHRLHPVQYLFVGAALCLFGLLQLSFAEHFGFEAAFAVATLAVVGMVTLYARSALQRTGRAVLVGGILSGCYAYLYAVLRAEDYALLGGSVALFVALAAAMYLTRKLDWFQPRVAQT